MICETCRYQIVQKFNLGDLNSNGEPILRVVSICDLLAHPIEKLIDCSMFENKNEEEDDDYE